MRTFIMTVTGKRSQGSLKRVAPIIRIGIRVFLVEVQALVKLSYIQLLRPKAVDFTSDIPICFRCQCIFTNDIIKVIK